MSSITNCFGLCGSEAPAKKAAADAPKSAHGHRFASNVFAAVAVVSVLAAAVALAVIFVPAVAAFAAPVTGFLAAKFGSLFAAYSIPTWAVPASLGVLGAVSFIVSQALKPSV